MSRPLPTQHVLVQLIARQLANAVHLDRVGGYGTPGPNVSLGPKATAIVAELVGAALGAPADPEPGCPSNPAGSPADHVRRMRKFLLPPV